jgi:serine O-acetyltransferase
MMSSDATKPAIVHPLGVDTAWARMRVEAAQAAAEEPILASFLHTTILHHDNVSGALSYRFGEKISDGEMNAMLWREVASHAYADEPQIVRAAVADILAYYDRDPACQQLAQPFLYFKGYQAIQAQRVGHWLWRQGRRPLALYLQSRVSELYDIDIHPAARLGRGLFFDHGHGIVIGETARVGDNVSLLHGVTLGGTGRTHGDRHPKVGNGVLIGAGAKILGNIEIGDGAKVAAGSVVLEAVKPFCTVAGVPARPVGRCGRAAGEDMDQNI